MKINILGGGPESLLPNLQLFNGMDDFWVGVDRGVHQLLSRKIKPFIAFGDFDSVSEEEFESISQNVGNLKKFHSDKDETDMELAITWALKQDPEVIRLFGGTGGRLDHLFANVQLLLRPILEGIDTTIEMIDNQNTVYVKSAGVHHVERMNKLPYISFIPITPEIIDLTLEGFKYPLKDCHIPLGSTLCISNELNNTYGTFSFTKGILMVIRSRDL